jgi:hypothetical protein
VLVAGQGDHWPSPGDAETVLGGKKSAGRKGGATEAAEVAEGTALSDAAGAASGTAAARVGVALASRGGEAAAMRPSNSEPQLDSAKNKQNAMAELAGRRARCVFSTAREANIESAPGFVEASRSVWGNVGTGTVQLSRQRADS